MNIGRLNLNCYEILVYPRGQAFGAVKEEYLVLAPSIPRAKAVAREQYVAESGHKNVTAKKIQLDYMARLWNGQEHLRGPFLIDRDSLSSHL